MNNYFRTPNRVFDLNLTSSEKLVLVYLCRCSNNAVAFPSYSTIANKCSINKRTAIRAIKTLEDKRLIMVIREYNKPNQYIVTLGGDK